MRATLTKQPPLKESKASLKISSYANTITDILNLPLAIRLKISVKLISDPGKGKIFRSIKCLSS